MKAKQLIYNLRTNFNAVDSQLKNTTDQHLMYMLDSARSILASQKMDNAVDIAQMSQTLDVVPKIATAKDIGLVGNEKVLKIELPKPIAYKNGIAIFTVGTTDGTESCTQITFSQLRTALHRKYTANSPKWFWLDNAIYVINRDVDSSSKLRVRGIFDEPYLVEKAMKRFKYLDPFEFEYPLSNKDAKTVYQLAMSSDLGWGDTAVQAVQSAERRQQLAAQKMRQGQNQDSED